MDYRNPDHVKAFVLAKQTNPRATAEDVLEILRRQETRFESTTTVKSDFWVVCKHTAPNPLPLQALQNIVSAEDLISKYKIPEDMDLRSVYVIDMACDRSFLGTRVRRVTFSEAISRRIVGVFDGRREFAAVTGAETDGGGVPGTPDSVPSASSQAAVSTLVPAPVALVPAPVALVSAPVALAPAPKRAKVLKMMASDPLPALEKEAADWQKLLGKINSAVKAGSFFSDDSSNYSTVHFWASQVCGRRSHERGETVQKQNHGVKRKLFLAKPAQN